MTQLPVMRRSSTTSAIAFTFRANERSGWAICTVNNRTGELAIQSDWGSWTYRWGGHFGERPDGTKKMLTEFISGCDEIWTDRDGVKRYGSYLADKLTAGKPHNDPEGRTTFDLRATVRHFGESLRDARRDKSIDRITHIRIADELADTLRDTECENPEGFLRAWYAIEDHEDVCSDAWEMTCYSETFSYRVLRDSIIPALSIACRESTVRPISEGECSYA